MQKKSGAWKEEIFWRSFGRSKHVWRLGTSADSVLFSNAGIVVEGRSRRRVLGWGGRELSPHLGLVDSSSESWSSWFQEWKISGSEEAAWASCEKLADEAIQKLGN